MRKRASGRPRVPSRVTIQALVFAALKRACAAEVIRAELLLHGTTLAWSGIASRVQAEIRACPGERGRTR